MLDRIEIRNFMLLKEPVTVVFNDSGNLNMANLYYDDILRGAEINNPNYVSDFEILNVITFMISFLVGEKMDIVEYCSPEIRDSGRTEICKAGTASDSEIDVAVLENANSSAAAGDLMDADVRSGSAVNTDIYALPVSDTVKDADVDADDSRCVSEITNTCADVSSLSEQEISSKSMKLVYYFTIENASLKYIINYNPELALLSEQLYIDEQQILTRRGSEGFIKIGDRTLHSNANQNESFLRRTAVITGRFPQDQVLNTFVSLINDSYTLEKYGITW